MSNPRHYRCLTIGCRFVGITHEVAAARIGGLLWYPLPACFGCEVDMGLVG